MNDDIMDFFGFGEEVKLVKQRICPFCKRNVDMDEFEDELSRKEYRISGLCQDCQDNIFGKSSKTAIKRNKEKTMSKDEAAMILGIDQKLIVNESCFGDYSDYRMPIELWDRYEARDGKSVWYVPANVDDYIKASKIHMQSLNGKRSEGYGGSTWEFKCTDGKTYSVQGPWNSNSGSLHANTGIDLRDKHKFYIVICEKTVYSIVSDNGRLKSSMFDHDPEYELRSKAAKTLWGQSGYMFQGYNELYRFTWCGSWEKREYEVAKKVIEHDKELYYTIQSQGGASSSTMSVECAKNIKNDILTKFKDAIL